MKDLLVALVEFIFYVDPDEEITLKKIGIIAFKVLIFVLILSIIIWLLLKYKVKFDEY